MKSLLAVISFLFFLQATLGQSVLSSVDYYYPFELGVARARYAVMLEYAAGQDSISFAFTINTNLVPGVSGAVIPGGVSPYENVDPALTEVVVRAWIAGTNVEVAQLLTEVCQATDYTFVLRADANGNYFLQKFVDDNSDLPSGYARVRVFHSSSRALFSLNLYDFANALSSNLLIGNIQPGDMSGYATIASGSHTFYVGAATGGVSPTQLAPQNLDNRATYTIWVVGNINALPNTLNSWRTVFSPDFTISPTTGAVIPQPKNGKTGYARIRFIAADSTVPNAQFQLGALPVTALNYGNASSYMMVQQGRNSYSVFQTGLRFIAIGTLYLTQNHDYTLVLRTRPDGVPEVRLYEDYNYTPKHGFANVRFMNLFTGIAPPVDLAFERFDIASNLKFGTHSRYVPIEVRNPPMPINLRIMEHLGLRRVLAVIPHFESNIFMATTYTCVLGGNGVKPMLMMFVDDGTGTPGAAETVSMDFDMAINTAIAAGKFPAVSAAIAQFSPNASSSLLWSKSYGYAQIEHTNRNSKNTMFLAGAVGEGLISTLVYWYNERNMISVTDSISKTLGFQINNPNMNNMNSLTWLDLLTHVSTIADNLDMLKMVFTVGGSDSPVGNCEFVRNYLVSGGMYYSEANYYTSTELKQSKFKYSHMNYATLACALETMTNQTFDELAWSMLLSKVKPMAPKRTSYFYQDLANFRRSAANYYKPTNSTWARVVRTATPIYSAYGMQTTAADLANIGAWMLINTPLNATTRAMMAMLTNDDTGEPGWNMTMGGYWTTTLSDGSRIYGYDSMGWFGNEWEPKEFSLSGGFWFSLTRNLVVSFLMNSFDYQDDQYNWVMSAFNANTYSSLTTTDAMSPNCQAHTTEVFCDQDPYCKWIVPWTIPAAGGLCVKAAANPVHILGPSAGVVPLNQYV